MNVEFLAKVGEKKLRRKPGKLRSAAKPEAVKSKVPIGILRRSSRSQQKN
jgi:hypothetical protein